MKQKYLAFLFLSFFISLTLSAQDESDLPAKTLMNNLQVAAWEDHSVPIIGLHAVIEGLAYQEETETEGMNFLLGNLIGKSSQQYFLEASVRQAAADNGILVRTSVDPNAIHLHLSLPKEKLTEGLELLHELLFNFYVDEENLAQQRRKIAARLQAAQENPEYYLNEAFEERFWFSWEYARQTFPPYEQISSYSAAEVTKFYQDEVLPERIMVIGGGDVEPETFLAQCEEILGGVPGFGSGENMQVVQGPVAGEFPGFVQENALANQPVFLAAWQLGGVSGFPREFVAARLLEAYLNHPNGFLKGALQRTGLASVAEVEYRPGRLISALQLKVIPAAGQEIPCMDTLRKYLPELLNQKWQEPRLAEVRRDLEYQFRFAREPATGFVEELAEAWAVTRTFRHVLLPEIVRNTESTDIERIVRKYIREQKAFQALQCNAAFREAARPGDWFREETASVTPEPPEDTIKKGPDLEKIQAMLANKTVYFELNSFLPDEESRNSLREVATFLQEHPAQSVYLDGHTDTQGNPDFNQRLSLKRAESVQQFLVENFQIPGGQLKVRGFGEENPRYPEETAEGRALNRRVEIVLIMPEKLPLNWEEEP